MAWLVAGVLGSVFAVALIHAHGLLAQPALPASIEQDPTGRERPPELPMPAEPITPPPVVADPQRVVVTPATPVDSQGTWLAVRVVDGPKGRPVAFADVWVDAVDATSQPEPHADASAPLDPFERLRARGRHVKADAAGWARVQVVRRALAVAEEGGRSGFADLDADEPPTGGHVIELRTEEAVTVRVVDGAGRPLPSVPIGLARASTEPESADWEPQSWLVARTDAGGEAALRHLQTWRWFGAEDAPGSLQVFVHAPGFGGVSAVVEPGKPRIELRLPAFGRVSVLVRDAMGRPVGDRPHWEATLRCGVDDPDAPEPAAIAVGVEGRAVFPYVALGLELTVSTWVPDVHLERTFAGPTHPGGESAVALELGDLPGVELRARLLYADRRVVADAEVTLTAPGDDAPMAILRTDHHGMVRARVTESFQSASELRLRVCRDGGGHGAVVRVACQPGAPLELGDVVVDGGRTFASGRVVTTMPMHVVDLRLEERGPDPTQDDWRPTERLSLILEPSGMFRIGCLWNDPTMRQRIVVRAPASEPLAPIEFRAGQSELVVALRPGGRLLGRLLLDAGLQADWRAIEVVLGEDDRAQHVDLYADSEGCQLAADDLETGSSTLRVRVAGQEVARVDNVRIASQLEADARLQPLDLRGRLAELRVRLVDGRQQLVASAGSVHWRTPGRGPWLEVAPWALVDGVVRGLVPAGPIEFLVTAAGFAPVLHAGFAGAIDIEVRPLTAVTVRWTNLPQLPAGEFHIAWSGGESSTDADLPAWLSPVTEPTFDSSSGRFACRLATALEARWRLLWRGSDGSLTEVCEFPCRLEATTTVQERQLPSAAIDRLRAFMNR